MKDRHKNKYAHRSYAVGAAILVVVFLYLTRLFDLQVLSPEYRIAAEDIAFLKKTLYPSRGMIYDCRGNLVVLHSYYFHR